MSDLPADVLGRMMGVFRGMAGLPGGVCFECGSDGPLHFHHVVPVVLGGKHTVPLCEACHGKVHGRGMVGHQRLILSGLAEARRKGRKLGRPAGTGDSPVALLRKHGDIVRLLRDGHSIRHAATISGKAPGTVQRVKALVAACSARGVFNSES